MKSDLLPTEEAEQLTNALVLICSSPQLYSKVVLRDFTGEDKCRYCAVGMYKRGQPYAVVVDGYLEC